MDVKQESFDFEGVIKTDPDEQIFKNEIQDVLYDSVNTLESKITGQFVNEHVNEEIIKCEEPSLDFPTKNDHDSLPENLQFLPKTIKRELENIEVKTTYFKQEEFTTKSELLTTLCDLPTLENESVDYPEYYELQCSDIPVSSSKANHHDGHSRKRFVVCTFCGTSVKKINLQKHLIIHSQALNCNICSKQFNEKSSFQTHIDTTHPIICSELFKCDICSKEFTKKCDLQRHLIIHSEQKIFKCDICSKNFNKKSNLKQHLLTHTNQKPFKCNICSKRFTNKSNFRRHLRTHPNIKRLKCEFCSKYFYLKSDLQKHLLIHTNQKPFKCDICSKELTTKSGLQTHLLIHAEQKPFKCNICSKEFIQNSNLQTHLMTHTNQKSFKCNICSREFIQKSSFQTHIKTHPILYSRI